MAKSSASRLVTNSTVDEIYRDARDAGALGGKLLGAGYLLGPFLPRGITLRQNPSWDSVDRAELQAAGYVRVFAGLVLCDLIWSSYYNVQSFCCLSLFQHSHTF